MFNHIYDLMKENRKLKEEIAKATAPIYVGTPTEIVPLYWLTSRANSLGTFPPRDSVGYTLSVEDALRFTGLRRDNSAQLVRGWKLPDGRIALKDPATAGLPMIANFWRPQP